MVFEVLIDEFVILFNIPWQTFPSRENMMFAPKYTCHKQYVSAVQALPRFQKKG